MSKNIMFKVALAVTGVAVAVLWLLSIIIPKTFGFFNLSWAIGIFSGLAGVLFILKGLLGKNGITLKKLNVFFGAGLLVVCVFAIAGAIALPTQIIFPIIAIILTAALFVGIVAVGGKKWDQGDNQNVGYKNYQQRKAEQEKQIQQEKDKEQDDK